VKVDVVVDIGNSCIKLGRCHSGTITQVEIRVSSDETIETIAADPHKSWAIGGVVAERVSQLHDKLFQHGCSVAVINHFQQIPIRLDVHRPETIGVDRLFDAVGAIHQYPYRKLLVVDAGTAITINSISSDGIFEGGVIIPGLRLMGQALNQNTAQLPLVEISSHFVFPGKDTIRSIQSGLLSAAIGAVEKCAKSYSPELLLFTGGTGSQLSVGTDYDPKKFVPTLTLEGIRIAAEALP